MNIKLTIQMGQNMYLRPLTCADVSETYVNWMNDYEIVKYTEQRFSEQTFDTVMQFVKAKQEASDEYLFGIFCEDRHIGNIKLGLINYHHLFADVSYFIGNRDYWGRGIATKSIASTVWFGTKILGLKKIKASYYENNVASAKVLKNCGFQHEGVRANEILFEGERINSVLVAYFPE